MHILNCEFRRAMCEHCRHSVVLLNHQKECPNFPVNCSECFTTFLRKDMEVRKVILVFLHLIVFESLCSIRKASFIFIEIFQREPWILHHKPHHSRLFSESHTHSFPAPNLLPHFYWVGRFSKYHHQGGMSNFLMPGGIIRILERVMPLPWLKMSRCLDLFDL